MTIEHSTSHAAEGDSALADRLRAIPGAVRKAPASPEVAKPATGATRADPFGKTAFKAPDGFVEVPAPAGIRAAPGAPRVRHFRAVEPGKIQHRADGLVLSAPKPTA